MKKTIILLLMILLSLQVFAQQNDEISVERKILGDVLPGNEVKIELTINFNVGEPNSVIITEEIPSGWKFVSSNPKATDFEGKKKWLLYGNSLSEGKKISYTLKAPENFNGTKEINGNWATVSGTGIITGDYTILEAAPLEPDNRDPEKKEPPKEDYTLFIIAGILIIVIAVTVFFVMKKKKK